MLRASRPRVADSTLNRQEHDWWNEHAPIISRLWEMYPEVSRAVRGAYLERVRQFFLLGRERATVLELGSGSGWVGQSIAGPRLRVVGTDFSELQVALARARAEASGLTAYCSYHVTGSADWPAEAASADCALIHAFLHHLDELEIEGVLRALRGRLRAGARILFYEPAFLSGPAVQPRGPVWLVGRAVHTFASALRVASAGLGLRDEATARKFDRLTQMAADNGWYLSPKEIPFDHDTFTASLRDHFAIRDSYWATVFLVGWAFETNLLRSALARRAACASFLPLAAVCDRFIAARAQSLGSALQSPNYGFAVWECEVPA